MNSCKSKSKEPSILNRIESPNTLTHLKYDDLQEDFKNFYQQFHKDSIFQMSCIFFPLEGLPDHADPEFIGNEKYYFSPDQWIFQNTIPIQSENYSVDYTNISNMLIEETITDKKLDLKLIRRFAKTGGGWRLIYYAGMNKYSSTN
ncbi:MAG: hypothetical protein IT267_03800 [Saprospiraceae bacterium]|nr:hypothetical protein [Saprospiraceae bacterium]